MHCYFVLNGNSEIPIIYHVEHVREGRSFATRTVQARQRGQPIFTTTLSFMREASGGKKVVEHQASMPDVPAPPDAEPMDVLRGPSSPFVTQMVDIAHHDSPHPHLKRTRQWIKCRGHISDEGGTQAHLSALAYMSDSYFIGTVARVHRLGRLGSDEKSEEKKSGGEEKRVEGEGERPEIGMMVSLDHSIYFHNPREFRADEWLCVEAEAPWAGDGRGFVSQRIFTRSGKLVASCVQEVSPFDMTWR
jgi:acyl-CoA thioesterase